MTSPTHNRVALVSGAARGLGKAIAVELLQAGWRVSVGSRSQPDLGEWGAALHWSPYDARDPSSEAEWVSSAVERFGRIDGVVHNAGILSSTSVIEATEAEVDEIFNVNVKSPRRITQYAWPYLKQSDQARVVVVASLAGKRVRTAEASLYALSKAAALSLAHGIRHCGNTEGIRATAICPGFIATDMAQQVPADIQAKITRPEDVAMVVRTVLSLPFTASIAEIPINWQVESEY